MTQYFGIPIRNGLSIGLGSIISLRGGQGDFPPWFFLQQENGDFLLQENGNKIGLE